MEKIVKLRDDQEAKILFGRHDQNLRFVEREFEVKIAARAGNIIILGIEDDAKKAARLFEELLTIIRNGGMLRTHDISCAIKSLKEDASSDITKLYLDKIEVLSKRLYVTPKTQGQKEYIDAIKDCDIVFAIGPAGTGKTYLAMAMAVNALKKQIISRIILTRPAVEAGESLGFLPGTFHEKIAPYLRPMYDALYDMLEADTLDKYIEKGVIEVAPLAYMRGRTLNDSFIILDEAQNSTPEQMKMFLTRLGFDSKTVITGDVTQSDLPRGKISGLMHAESILKNIEGIKFIELTEKDVVRHALVQEIIKAYEATKKI
jgi:phosphate starvation-inducible PhoH-like protein